MSYDISSWSTKTIKDLKVPIKDMLIWGIDSSVLKDGRIQFRHLCEGFGIDGVLGEDGIVSINRIEHWGEGSGNTYDALCGILSHSTGELVAILVWENGEEIYRLTVKNGLVEDKIIEID